MVRTMRAVTDPNLISQLEQPVANNMGQPITDPNLISQLEDQNVPRGTLGQNETGALPDYLRTMLPGVDPNFAVNFGLGALGAGRNLAQDVADIPPWIANKVGINAPYGQLPQVPQGQGLPAQLGAATTNIGAFMAGGAPLEAGRAALAGTESLPGIAKVAQWLGGEVPNIPWQLGGSKLLPGITSAGVGGALYGGLTNPQDRGIGALEGGAIAAPFGAASAIPGAIASAKQFMNPTPAFNNIQNILKTTGETLPTDEQSLEQIKQTLGAGQGIEENNQTIAQNVEDSYNAQKQRGKDVYGNILNRVGSDPIYTYPLKGNWGISGGLEEDKSVPQGLYDSIPQSIKDTFGSNITDLDQAFSDNPTFQNAHQLQSQLGSEIGKLDYASRRGPLQDSQYQQLANYSNSRNALKEDMGSFLQKTDPSLQATWSQNTADWKNNVIPYQSDPSLYKMAQGKLSNPTVSQIKSVFASPEPEIQKVVADLPPDSSNKILYSQLGQTSAMKNSGNMINSFNKLDQQGLASYASPDLESQINDLGNVGQKRETLNQLNTLVGNTPDDLAKNINKLPDANSLNALHPDLNSQLSQFNTVYGRQNMARHIGGALGGVALTHAFGLPPILSELLGGGAGLKFGPSVFSGLSKIPGVLSATRGIKTGIGSAYPYASTAIRGATIPGGGQ